jgi:hypothetical protein
MLDLKRRAFITLLAGVAAWLVAAHGSAAKEFLADTEAG